MDPLKKVGQSSKSGTCATAEFAYKVYQSQYAKSNQ